MYSVILSNLMYMYTDYTFLIEFIIDKNITKKKTQIKSCKTGVKLIHNIVN